MCGCLWWREKAVITRGIKCGQVRWMVVQSVAFDTSSNLNDALSKPTYAHASPHFPTRSPQVARCFRDPHTCSQFPSHFPPGAGGAASVTLHTCSHLPLHFPPGGALLP